METGEAQQKQHPTKEKISHLRRQIRSRIPEAEKILAKSGMPKQEQPGRLKINTGGALLRKDLDSGIDSLTGLYNRRFLMNEIERTIKEADRFNLSFSVVAIDLDNFKPVNDTLGHAAGDEVLKKVAQIYKSTLRETDITTRPGGDEFIVILLGAKNGAARKTMEKVRISIENTLAEDMRNKGIQVVGTLTQTAGIVTYEKGLTPFELLHRADVALYNGKKPKDGSAAKNRVVSYVKGMIMPGDEFYYNDKTK